MALAPTDVAGIEETTAIRLVAAHRDGDRDAFAEIVRTHYPSLLATARHRLQNSEDAKDAVQETLLRALLALDRFGDTGDWRLGAWLNTILIHVCADFPARRKPTAPLSDWLIETHPDECEEATSDYVALAAVQRAIDDLPESQRRAFELRLVDGRPYDEVAGALGITEVNARARVRRARTNLQHRLESTDAVKGAWAATPLLLTSPFRSVFRRLFTAAGNSAGAAGTQAISSSASQTGASAASAIAGTPVETGIQLITQVSATPLGQAVVASATGVPGRGSVVLGIVASLATAGGLSAPAVISGSTAPSTAPPVQASLIAPSSSTSTSPTSQTPAASTPAKTTANKGSIPTGSSAFSGIVGAPNWAVLAASETVYKVLSSGTSESPSGSSGPSPGVSTTTTSASSSTATSASSSTTSPATSTSATQGSGATTQQDKTPAGATKTGKTAPSSSASPSSSGSVTLPIGTCAGVTGFPGVTAPTSLPALASSTLSDVLTTGSLNLATVSGSPAFGGTALVKPPSGLGSEVRVKVGTCLADGGSILAVDMTGSTGDEAQLVGSLVAQPYVAATGSDTYLFRGNVTQLAGTAQGGLPWGLPQAFVAEVQVQQNAKTAALNVVFLRTQSGSIGTSATSNPSTAVAPGTGSTIASAGETAPEGAAGTAPTTRPTGAKTTAATAGTRASSAGTSTSQLSHPLMLVGGGSQRSI